MAVTEAPTVTEMELQLRALIQSVSCKHLRRLLAIFFAQDSESWASYRDAPAAKRYHQAYAHGLLEHSLAVAQVVSSLSAIFDGVDRDLAVTGALLHDLGKLDAYTASPSGIELTDEGRLHGEIALGFYRVRRAIESLDGFPEERARALEHIILSHHGQREYGSPVVPCTREATLVHAADDLSAKLGSFDRLQHGLAAGASWSSYDKVLGGSAYFSADPLADDEPAMVAYAAA